MTEKRSRRCDIGVTGGAPGPPTRPGIGGGFCVGGACEGACARIVASFLESRKNEVKTPATNDANAIVILDITPPEITGGAARYGSITTVMRMTTLGFRRRLLPGQAEAASLLVEV